MVNKENFRNAISLLQLVEEDLRKPNERLNKALGLLEDIDLKELK